MPQKREEIGIVIAIIFAVILINYQLLDKSLENFLKTDEEILVQRIIDGDTIEAGNRSIRLLGINTPERREFLHEEAKNFLENLVLNKTVTLRFGKDRYDKYQRILAYVFLENKNINVELVKNGFANYYFYDGKDKYSDDLIDAWKICMENKVNLCEPSQHQCSSCITVDSNSIINSCSFSCNITQWSIKGEGREKFVFEGQLSPSEKEYFELDLTNSGGGLFLRDKLGKLVYWEGQ